MMTTCTRTATPDWKADAMGTSSVDDLEVDALRRACTRELSWHGQRSPAEMLAELPAGIETDLYGDGGVADQHEDRAYERLHGLTGRPVGELDRLLTVDNLDEVTEPLAALVLELGALLRRLLARPQRSRGET